MTLAVLTAFITSTIATQGSSGASVFRTAVPSVVSISTRFAAGTGVAVWLPGVDDGIDPIAKDVVRRYFEKQQGSKSSTAAPQEATTKSYAKYASPWPGSRFVLTAYHVVDGDHDIDLGQGKPKVIAVMGDSDADVATFLDRPWSRAISLVTDSSKIFVGKEVFVIGSPLGLEHTLSQGIISGNRNGQPLRYKNGTFKSYQISAPVSKGSSGSPVLTASSNVVGIVTSSLVDGQSLNFAASCDDILEVFARSMDQASEMERLAKLGLTPPRWSDMPIMPISWLLERGKHIDSLIVALCSRDAAWQEHHNLVVIGRPTVKRLLRALDAQSDILSTMKILRALGEIGDVRAFEPIVVRLSDLDWHVRSSACSALGWLGMEAALPHLTRMLGDQEKEVAKSAQSAIDVIKLRRDRDN